MGVFTEKIYISHMTTMSTVHVAWSLENTILVRIAAVIKASRQNIHVTMKPRHPIILSKYFNIKLTFKFNSCLNQPEINALDV